MRQSSPIVGPEASGLARAGQLFDLAIAFLRRRYLSVLICLVLSLTLGALYLFTATPTYTASSTMMIEVRKPLFRQSLLGDAPPDAAWIDSQIGVLKSQSVAAYVVKQLRLADDPEFTREIGLAGLLDKILTRLGWASPPPNTDAERVAAAIGAVGSGLDVRRVGLSYLIKIDFRSPNPEQAVKISNAMIDGYIFDQLNAKYQANRRAGDWLQERLQTLREQAAAAERAVVEFKAKNNIVAAGGALMNEKQLSEASGQLAAARARSSDLQVRLERIEAVRKAYQQDQPASGVDETVSEAMSNAIIGKLQTQYLDLRNREADWSARYGRSHTAVVNLRNQIRDIRKSIRDELGRIEETYRSEYEIANKRQDELEKGLGKHISQSTATNQAQITLFSLESAAQSYRKLYDDFLQRHTESVQQQSFPISDARQVSPASASQTYPRALKVWLLAGFAGGVLGVGLGVFREIRDCGFRTREQVRSILDTECLALVPLLTGRRRMLTSSRVNSAYSGWQPLPVPSARKQAFAGSAIDGEPRCIGSAPKIMRIILDQPSSLFAEAIRAIKLTVDQSRKDKVVGLTSCLASEGKSSIAAAMATLIAGSGSRVILVDCDVRNPALSRALAPDASVGLLDVFAGRVPLADAIWSDPASNLAFLPAVANASLPNATEMLASEAAKSLFGILQLKYDYVIVDLAPLAAAMDVRATSGLVDSYLLVIEWGITKIDAVQYALRHAPTVQANIVGAVLNKVDVAAMSRYDGYGVNYYYGRSRRARPLN
jgi:succinoglycan biosynthesis transport protein ExoP